MKKLLIAFGILIIVVGLIWYGQQKSETIKIGFIAPFSDTKIGGSEEQQLAFDLAVEEINAAGGINGRPLEIIYEDGKCDPATALTAAQKLIMVDKIKFLIPACTAETLAIAPLVEKSRVVMMAVWSTHPKVSEAGDYIFRNSYSDDGVGRVLVELISSRAKKVAVVTELSDYSIGLRDVFKKYFKGILIEENYSPETTDIRTHILRVVAAKPEAIFLNPNSAKSGFQALQELRRLGFRGQIYGNFFGGVEEVIALSEAEGLIFIGDPAVPNNSRKERLFAEFEKRRGKKPDFDFAVGVSYDGIYMFKEAFETVGTDPEKVREYLANLKNFNGVFGTYGFDENGDATGLVPSIKQIKNKTVVPYISCAHNCS